MEPIKKTVYIVFNKHNGVLFSYEDSEERASGYNKDHFVYKKFELEPRDYFFGDFYTGKVYSYDEKPLVREDEMEENLFESIYEVYSPLKQLNIILEVIKQNPAIKTTPEFESLYKFTTLKREKYKEQIEAVSQDKDAFNFMSLLDIKNLSEKRMQGIV